MQLNSVKILAECLLDVLTDWYLGDTTTFEHEKGRLEGIRDMIIRMEINKDELVGGLDDIRFTEQLASKILGGDRA